MFRTGFSKVNAWRKCNKLYEYAVVRNLQPKRRAAYFLRGTILHEMLEARDNGKKAGEVFLRYDTRYGALFEEEREFYGEHFMDDIWRIYKGYVRTYKGQDWQVLATEGLVRTQLTPKIEFEGHYDLRVQHQRRHWIADRKCMKSIPDSDERFANVQMLLYVEAWNREHPRERVEGIIWDYLRTKAPTIPEVLKRGQLTRRKDLDTDVYTYRQAIQDNELEEDAYAYYLKELGKRPPDRFYARVPLPVPSKEMTATIIEEFTQTAEMMRTAKHFPRNLTFMCPQCEMFKLCKAELSGINAKFVEKNDYEQRPEDTREKAEEAEGVPRLRLP